MEFFQVRGMSQKVVSLFFEPDEFVVRSHPIYSNLQALDDVEVNPFPHSLIISTLRRFPESHDHYREMRRRYQEKVTRRMNMLQTMTPSERLSHLQSSQSWVFSKVEKADIASYLGVSEGMLNKMLRGD